MSKMHDHIYRTNRPAGELGEPYLSKVEATIRGLTIKPGSRVVGVRQSFHGPSAGLYRLSDCVPSQPAQYLTSAEARAYADLLIACRKVRALKSRLRRKAKR